MLKDGTERIYTRGRLLMMGSHSVSTDRLGSVVRHGAATTQNRVKFATYTRDPDGSDYAWNRQYGTVTGRFTTPDPSHPGMAEAPESWNGYSYVQSDPINYLDPEGLVPCGSLMHGPTGRTVKQLMTTYDDFGYLAMTAWHEAGPILVPSDLQNMDGFYREQGLIVSALLNRWDMTNGRMVGYTASGNQVAPVFGGGDKSLKGVILQAAGNNKEWGIFADGRLRTTPIGDDKQSAAQRLNVALASDSGSTDCTAVLSAISHTQLLLIDMPGFRYGFMNNEAASPVIVLFWNKWGSTSTVPTDLPQDLINAGRVRSSGDTWCGYNLLPPSRSAQPCAGRGCAGGRPGPGGGRGQ